MAVALELCTWYDLLSLAEAVYGLAPEDEGSRWLADAIVLLLRYLLERLVDDDVSELYNAEAATDIGTVRN